MLAPVLHKTQRRRKNKRRYALDPNGRHAKLVETLHQINSRLVSPLQVHQILEAYGARSITHDQLAAL